MDSTNLMQNIIGNKNTYIKEECSICLNPIKQMTKWDKLHLGYPTTTNSSIFISKLYCKHLFHRKCIEKWLLKSNSCPNCRAIIY